MVAPWYALLAGENVEPFRATNRISDSDKARLMGAATARLYGWSPRQV